MRYSVQCIDTTCETTLLAAAGKTALSSLSCRIWNETAKRITLAFITKQR